MTITNLGCFAVLVRVAAPITVSLVGLHGGHGCAPGALAWTMYLLREVWVVLIGEFTVPGVGEPGRRAFWFLAAVLLLGEATLYALLLAWVLA